MRRKKKTGKLKSIISLSIIMALIFLVFFYVNKIYDKPQSGAGEKYNVKGIDVSHHNPILDWTEVKNQNILFAYIKATEGITHDDRNYKYNYKLAKENKVIAGSYHFYNFGISGREQAKHFINIAKCESGDLLPAIDVEHSIDNPYSTDTAFIQNVIKELKILEKRLYEYYGVHPLIYTNTDCYKLYINGRFTDNLIWISSPDNEPTDDIFNWVIWQFTHKGELPGIVGNIDFNYFRYPYEQLNLIRMP